MNTHIIHYAKGHYGKSEDAFRDLSIIINRWSALPKDHEWTNGSIIQLVWEVFINAAPQHCIKSFATDALSNGNIFFNECGEDRSQERILHVMLSGLYRINVKKMEEEGKSLGEYWCDIWLNDDMDEKESTHKFLCVHDPMARILNDWANEEERKKRDRIAERDKVGIPTWL